MAVSQTPSSSPEYTVNFSYKPRPEPFVLHIFFGSIPEDFDYELAYKIPSWVGQICTMAQPHDTGINHENPRLQASMPLTRRLLKHLNFSTSRELSPDMVGSFVQENMRWCCVGVSVENRKEIPQGGIVGDLSVVRCGSDSSVLWRSSV